MSSFWVRRGVGKTHLAVGLAVEALRHGYTAYFLSSHELIAMIRENIQSGRIHRKIKALCKPSVLIIDEIGYATTPLLHAARLGLSIRILLIYLT